MIDLLDKYGLDSLHAISRSSEANHGGAMIVKRLALFFFQPRILLAVTLLLLPSAGFAQSFFFQGKTIIIIQGRDPGGTGDLRVRALVPFLQ
jgi:hypothetical protein